MTDITQLSEQVITAIRQTEEYITYHRLLDELKTDPVVFARVRELQRQNFEIQNSDCADMLDRIDRLTNDFIDVINMESVSEFMEAEASLCKIARDLSMAVTEAMGLM